MSTISRWVLIDLNDVEQDYEYSDYEEAKTAAEKAGFALAERLYELTETALSWTPNSEISWPPKKPR